MKLHVFLLVILSITCKFTQIVAKVNVEIDEAEISISDKDQEAKAFIPLPSKIATPLVEADQHQKVLLVFKIKDKATKKAIKAHQTFVQFVNQETKKEVVLIAETAGQESQYRLDLPVSTSASNFGHSSGIYEVNLIIGDASISNPLIWKVGSIGLTFPRVGESGKSVASWSKQSYDPLPVITHEFRQPEKRPPSVVSDAFTVLAIIPIFILLGLWIKLGVNLSDFSFSLASIGFHTGLTLIFAIFVCFWTTMNMFTTLKCLSGVVLLTLISGHSLLKTQAAKKGN